MRRITQPNGSHTILLGCGSTKKDDVHVNVYHADNPSERIVNLHIPGDDEIELTEEDLERLLAWLRSGK
jgi:hypothetical protein